MDEKQVEHLGEEPVVIMGDAVKAIGDDGRVGGYLVRFTDADRPDLTGDFFTAQTDFGPHRQTVVMYHHGADSALGLKQLGGKLADLRIDDEGVWIEAQLDLRDQYERMIYERMAKQGKLGWSSGTAGHLVKRSLSSGKAYHIDSWWLGLDASLTPQPAAGPVDTAVVPLKSFVAQVDAPPLKAWLQEEADETASVAATVADVEAEPEAVAEATPEPEQETEAATAKAVVTNINTNQEPDTAVSPIEAATTTNPQKEVPAMDPEALKTLLSEAVATAVLPLRDKLAVLEADVTKMALVPDNDPGRALPAEKAVGVSPAVLRFSDPSAALKQVQVEAAEGDFHAFNHDQSRAFAKMVRDPYQLSIEEQRLLKKQVFPPTHLKMLLDEGMEARAIKDLQQVAQGQLGGYAMPPLMQERIVTALPGRVVMRGNGATVITMTGESNSYPVTIYKNNSGQYVGMVRGSFSSETGAATEANYNTEQVDIRLETYLYKIRKTSRELAIANLQQILERDIVDTMAMDEDRVFLTGSGAGVPLGVLPGGTNALGFEEVISGGASTLTTAGIKKLKRGLYSQYRAGGVFVANSDTYGEIELLTVSGTGSDWAFPSLSENDTLLRRPALESGFMPDVAGNAYPLMYINPAGYYIVEMPGMTVARLQDTSTSLNKVEIHVMKLLGGRPVEPWAFAVQKVASS